MPWSCGAYLSGSQSSGMTERGLWALIGNPFTLMAAYSDESPPTQPWGRVSKQRPETKARTEKIKATAETQIPAAVPFFPFVIIKSVCEGRYARPFLARYGVEKGDNDISSHFWAMAQKARYWFHLSIFGRRQRVIKNEHWKQGVEIVIFWLRRWNRRASCKGDWGVLLARYNGKLRLVPAR